MRDGPARLNFRDLLTYSESNTKYSNTLATIELSPLPKEHNRDAAELVGLHLTSHVGIVVSADVTRNLTGSTSLSSTSNMRKTSRTLGRSQRGPRSEGELLPEQSPCTIARGEKKLVLYSRTSMYEASFRDISRIPRGPRVAC